MIFFLIKNVFKIHFLNLLSVIKQRLPLLSGNRQHRLMIPVSFTTEARFSGRCAELQYAKASSLISSGDLSASFIDSHRARTVARTSAAKNFAEAIRPL
ncbi:MAG: hypothetical protein A4E71_03127 [Smithella sp. PtaU1.Bin162]|nr:MAG: hypothetical protein A4E71_03127 [Smithella sp. PtaU1.Bin162]